jgi:hypothetical protein
MTRPSINRRKQITSRYRKCPILCKSFLDTEVTTLGSYFSVFNSLLEPGKLFWFRGHSDLEYELKPSALRYKTREQVEQALALVADMKRYLVMKLDRPPEPDDHLGWMQVAQHYGLPTRLLDWTQNAAVALFFACNDSPGKDGLVVVLNPVELNQVVDPKLPRILNYELDELVIKQYFNLGGAINRGGQRTIALNPTWNTERIVLQQGFFTLHGSRQFDLDNSQASSLLYVPILRENKEPLLNELERVGIGEMFIYPEPEHVCSHLRRTAKL